jgi:ankyrin repeat protein
MTRLLLVLTILTTSALANDCYLPIHTAAEAGDAAKLQRLLAKDRFQADAEDKCETGIRPVLLAAHSGSAMAVQALLDAGASTNVAHSGNGLTPLIAAAAGGSAEIVRLLLGARAAVDASESRNCASSHELSALPQRSYLQPRV